MATKKTAVFDSLINVFSDISSDDIIVLTNLEEIKGSAPIQLASSTGINLSNIVNSIDKLEKIGFVEIDENEERDLGEKWAFCSVTQEGHDFTHGFRNYK